MAKGITGQTYVALYRGRYWPVVLCSEHFAPPKFLETRRKEIELPAILLGKRFYIWVLEENLHRYYPDHDYLRKAERFDQPEIRRSDSTEAILEKQRQLGFTMDAKQGKDDSYWSVYIKSGQRAAQVERVMQNSGSKSQVVRSNRVPPTTQHRGLFPVIQSREQVHPFLSRPKQDVVMYDFDSDTESEFESGDEAVTKAVDEEAEDEEMVEGGQAEAIEHEAKTDEARAEEAKDEAELLDLRASNEAWARSLPHNPEANIVFIGLARKPFQIPSSVFSASPAFQSLKQTDSSPNGTLGVFADLSPPLSSKRTHSTSSITIQSFLPLLRCMQGDVDSQLGLRKSLGGSLDLNFSNSGEAGRLAKLYIDAAEIGYGDLQLAIVQRLQKLLPGLLQQGQGQGQGQGQQGQNQQKAKEKALKTLLAIVKLLMLEAKKWSTPRYDHAVERVVEGWMAGVVAANFWGLVSLDHNKNGNGGGTGGAGRLNELLGQNEGLRRKVFGQMAGK